MKIDDATRLNHIIDSIAEIESYVKGINFDNFMSNSLVVNASINQLIIIGEATKNISEKLKSENDEIEWQVISGMRNVLVHEYFGLDYEIIWNVIKNKLPALKNSILKILKNLK
jgi:uncharacterized protein with HEPN domain